MKHLIIIALIAVSGFVKAGDVHKQSVSSSIESVVLYRSGAQIERTLKIVLKPGVNQVKLTGLSPYLIENSISVKHSGSAKLQSAQKQTNHLTQVTQTQEYISLRKSADRKKLGIQKETILLEVLLAKQKLILSNKQIKGNNQHLTIDEILDLSEFYQGKLSEIEHQIVEKKDLLSKLKKEYQKMDWEASSKKRKAQNTADILLSFSTERSITSTITVQYLVMEATWSPLYDVKSDGGSKIGLSYKAQIQQKTGIDWNNVQLQLSTGKPLLSQTQPELSAWQLQIAQNYHGKKRRHKMRSASAYYDYDSVDRNDDYEEIADDKLVKEPELIQSTIQNSGTTVEYQIPIKYSIPATAEPYLVEVARKDLASKNSHLILSKYDRSAYLIQKVKNEEGMNLIPGNANLFLGDIYTGDEYLEFNSFSDSLDISFGRDPNVLVERKKLMDKRANSVSTSKLKMGIGISIRNNKNVPIEVTLKDNIPLSKIKSVEVSFTKAEGAHYDEESGILTWKFTLAPGAKMEKQFFYQVKYPKGSKPTNL